MISASPRFSKNSDVAALIAAIISIVLILLVPYGRILQQSIEPWLTFETALLGTCALLLLLTLYYIRLVRLARSLFPPHLTCLVSLLLLCVLTVDQIVEWAHPFLYATLSSAALLATGDRRSASSILSALVYASAISLSDELLQGLDPSRVFDFRDLLLNSWGILIGILFTSPTILTAELES